jgi:hypothetical protein
MALAYSALPLQGADAKSVLPKNHFCVVDFHDPRQIAVEFRGPQTNASVTVPLHTSGH